MLCKDGCISVSPFNNTVLSTHVVKCMVSVIGVGFRVEGFFKGS